MAATDASAALSEAHRLAQGRLAARTVRLLLASWSILDLERLDATVADWLTVSVPIVQSQRQASARLASNYLTAFRSAELGLDAGQFTPVLADLAPIEQLTTSLVATGPVRVKQAVSVGTDLVKAGQTAQGTSASAGMRHALNGGRETIIDTVHADTKALGWARATSGSPCSFCALLAGRGPVYKSSKTARFEAHDHCTCATEPVYHRDADWPPGSRRYAGVYAEAKASDGDTLSNFRRLIEAA